MKLWLKRTLVGIAAAGILIGGLSACSGHHHGWGGAEGDTQRHAKMVDYAGKKLDLNDAQKQRLNVLVDKLHEQRTALVGSSKDPRAEIQALVAGDKLDRAKVQALIDDKTSAIKTKSPELVSAAADFFDSLNPAQQQQIRDLMNRRRGWRS